MLRFLLFISLFLIVGQSKAQEKYSAEWYFDSVQRSILESFDKLSFEHGQFITKDQNDKLYFVKVDSIDQLQRFSEIIPAHKVKGIALNKSIKNFPHKETLEILKTFSNLDILEFETSSLFNLFPEKTEDFPEYITELKHLKILSFRNHVNFEVHNLNEFTSQMPRLQGLFFISFYDSINAKVLNHPNITNLMITSRNFVNQKIDENSLVKNINLISAKSDKSINSSMGQLQSFISLEKLNLQYARFEGEGYFSGIPQLKHLNILVLDSLDNTNFYKELTVLKKLESLDIWLEENDNQEIDHLGKLTNLKKMKLGRVSALNNPSFLKKLIRLEELEILECQVDLSKFKFLELKSLKKLSVDYSNVDIISQCAFDESSLEFISFSDNQLRIFPSLSGVPNLKVLNLKNNQLSNSVFLDQKLDQLETILLDNNQLMEFEIDFRNTPNLKTLSLDNNCIESLTASFSKLKNLEELSLSQNSITDITGIISENHSIKNLSLDYNNLKTLPDELGNLKNLEVLEVSKNRLETLPSNLTNLKTLDISNQGLNSDESELYPLIAPLQSLPQDFQTYTNLKKINLSGNSNLNLNPLWELLNHFPDNQTVYLNLSNMGQVALPEGEFWSMIYWETLDLTNNSIENLPIRMQQRMKFDWLELGKIEGVNESKNSIRFNDVDEYMVFLEVNSFPVETHGMNDSLFISHLNRVARNYSYPLQPDKILKIFELANQRNDELAKSIMDYSPFSNALFAMGDYNTALPLFEEELDNIMNSNVRFINHIEDLIANLEAIYESKGLSNKLLDLWVDTGKELNKPANFTKAALMVWDKDRQLADSLMLLGLEFYSGNLDWHIKNNQPNLGLSLDYLEAAIIGNNAQHQNNASEVYIKWVNEANENLNGIFNYLKGIIKILRDEKTDETKLMTLKGWDFSLISQWISFMEPSTKKNNLESWNQRNIELR